MICLFHKLDKQYKKLKKNFVGHSIDQHSSDFFFALNKKKS